MPMLYVIIEVTEPQDLLHKFPCVTGKGILNAPLFISLQTFKLNNLAVEEIQESEKI